MNTSNRRFLDAGGFIIVSGLFVWPGFVDFGEPTVVDDYLFGLVWLALAAAHISLAFRARVREQDRFKSEGEDLGEEEHEPRIRLHWPRDVYEAVYQIFCIVAILFIVATLVVVATA